MVQVPGNEPDTVALGLLVPVVVVVEAAGLPHYLSERLGDAVPRDDSVPVVDEPVYGKVIHQRVEVGPFLEDRDERLVGRGGQGRCEAYHLLRARLLLTVGAQRVYVPLSGGLHGPHLLVHVTAAAIGKAAAREGAVDLLDHSEEAKQLAVDDELRVRRPGREHARLTKEAVAQHVVHLRRVALHRVEVQALEAVEAKAVVVLAELQLEG